MTKAELKVKLPCGLRYEIKMDTWFGEINFTIQDIECPLHGKKCKK